MTPRVRRLAIATGLLLVALFAISAVRRARTRARAAPLAQALVDFLTADREAILGLEDIVAANRHDCAKAEQLGLANFDRLAPRRGAALELLNHLPPGTTRGQIGAVLEMGMARVGDSPERLKSRQAEALEVLKQFKKDCPAQAASLDRRMIEYVATGLQLPE